MADQNQTSLGDEKPTSTINGGFEADNKIDIEHAGGENYNEEKCTKRFEGKLKLSDCACDFKKHPSSINFVEVLKLTGILSPCSISQSISTRQNLNKAGIFCKSQIDDVITGKMFPCLQNVIAELEHASVWYDGSYENYLRAIFLMDTVTIHASIRNHGIILKYRILTVFLVSFILAVALLVIIRHSLHKHSFA